LDQNDEELLIVRSVLDNESFKGLVVLRYRIVFVSFKGLPVGGQLVLDFRDEQNGEDLNVGD